MRNSLKQTDTKAALDASFFLSCALFFVAVFKFLMYVFQNLGANDYFSKLVSISKDFALPSFFVIAIFLIFAMSQKFNPQVSDMLSIPYNDMKYGKRYAFFFHLFRFLGILFLVFSCYIFVDFLFSNAVLFIVGVLIGSVLFAQFAKISGWHD